MYVPWLKLSQTFKEQLWFKMRKQGNDRYEIEEKAKKAAEHQEKENQ